MVADISPCDEKKKKCTRSGEFFSYISSFEPFMDFMTETKVTGFKIKISESSERSLGETREMISKS